MPVVVMPVVLIYSLLLTGQSRVANTGNPSVQIPGTASDTRTYDMPFTRTRSHAIIDEFRVVSNLVRSLMGRKKGGMVLRPSHRLHSRITGDPFSIANVILTATRAVEVRCR